VESPTIISGQACEVGTRHARNEDVGLVVEDLLRTNPGSGAYVGPRNKKLTVISVFDGHGGHLASQWANKNLHAHFAELVWRGNYVDMLPQALRQSFARCETEFCAWSKKKRDTSGSCATMVLVRGDLIFTANAGDSKAIVFQHPIKPDARPKHVDLNPRHGAHLKTERVRIQKAGGRISADGAVYGILYPTRGFGDIDVKGNGKPVIIATPEGAGIEDGSLLPQAPYKLKKDHVTYLIVATDGLWDFATEDEVKDIVMEEYQKNVKPSPDNIAKEILELARDQGSDDDITVIFSEISFPRKGDPKDGATSPP